MPGQRKLTAYHFGYACRRFVIPDSEALHDLETLILRFILILVYTFNISVFIL